MEIKQRKFVSKVNEGTFVSVEEACETELANGQELDALTLQGTGLQRLDGLSEFISLQEANLSGNALTMLRACDLAGLTQLCFLNLAGNSLTDLPPGCFPPLPHLERLNLSYNLITGVEGLSVLAGLRQLDLRGNKLARVQDLFPLKHSSQLRNLYLQAKDGSESNPLCNTPDYRQSTIQALPSLEELDYQTVQVSEEANSGEQQQQQQQQTVEDGDGDVKLPKFEKATERFLRRLEQAALRRAQQQCIDQQRQAQEQGGGDLQDEGTEDVSSRNVQNPWDEGLIRPQRWERKPRSNSRRIVHTRVVVEPEQLFSREQRDFLHRRAVTKSKLIPLPQVLDRLGIPEGQRQEMEQSLDPLLFQMLLERCGVKLSQPDIAKLISLGTKNAPELSIMHVTEILAVMQQSSTGKQTQLKRQRSQQQEMKPAEQERLQSDDNNIEEQRSDGDETSKEKAVKSQQVQTEQAREEEQELVVVKEVASDSEPTPEPVGAVELAPQHEALEKLLGEMNALRTRLETKDDDRALQERIGKLEQQFEQRLATLSQHSQMEVREYKEKLEQQQKEKDRCIEETQRRLSSEIDSLKAKVDECTKSRETVLQQLQVSRQETQQAREECSVVKEKLLQAQDKTRALEEDMSRWNDAARMTQSQLADQASSLAAKLAESQLREKEYLMQAQTRSKEATDLGERLGVVLEELRDAQRDKDKSQDELQRLRQQVRKLEADYDSCVQQRKSQAEKASTSIRELKQELAETQERERRLSRVAKEQQCEIETLVDLVRSQKNSLARVGRALAQKEVAFKKLKDKLDETHQEHKKEMESLQLNYAALERKLRDVDSEKALALRAQNEADLARENLLKAEQKFRLEKEELVNKINDLQSTVDVKNVMLADQNATLVSLQRQLKEAQSAESHVVRELETQLQKLEDRLAYVEERRAEAEDALEEQQQLVESYEESVKELDTLREKAGSNEQLKKDLEHKAQTLELVEEEISRLRADFRRKEKQLEDRQEEILRLKHRLEEKDVETQEEKKELVQSLDKMRLTSAELQQRLERVIATKDELESKAKEASLLKHQLQEKEELVSKLGLTLRERDGELKVLAKALDLERRKGVRNVRRFEKLVEEMRSD